MKRLVLNMVYRLDLYRILAMENTCNPYGFFVTQKPRTLIYPLFLRDVGKYYWDKKTFKPQHGLTLENCVKNNLVKTFKFFELEKLLFEAVEQGNIKIVKYTVEQGVDVRVWNDCALRKASLKGHLEIVKYLVEHGADLRGYDILWACTNEHFEVFTYLAKCRDFSTFLYRASAEGRLKLVKYLVEHGADIHAENDRAFRVARKYRHRDVVEYLRPLL